VKRIYGAHRVRYRHLLEDEDVRRWYQNVDRSITARVMPYDEIIITDSPKKKEWAKTINCLEFFTSSRIEPWADRSILGFKKHGVSYGRSRFLREVFFSISSHENDCQYPMKRCRQQNSHWVIEPVDHVRA